jgi:hypothetical protein
MRRHRDTEPPGASHGLLSHQRPYQADAHGGGSNEEIRLVSRGGWVDDIYFTNIRVNSKAANEDCSRCSAEEGESWDVWCCIYTMGTTGS